MSDKKVTDVMLDRIKLLIDAIENGEYDPEGYTFAIDLFYQGNKKITIQDRLFIH